MDVGEFQDPISIGDPVNVDTYQLGLSLILTPGATLDEMRTVNDLLVSLSKEVAASAAPAEFKAGLVAFYGEWKSFYDANSEGVGAWLSRGFGATYAKVMEYKNRLADWRDRFVKLGFKSQTEAPQGAGVPSKAFPWTAVAIGSGVALGAVLVIRGFLARGK